MMLIIGQSQSIPLGTRIVKLVRSQGNYAFFQGKLCYLDCSYATVNTKILDTNLCLFVPKILDENLSKMKPIIRVLYNTNVIIKINDNSLKKKENIKKNMGNITKNKRLISEKLL